MDRVITNKRRGPKRLLFSSIVIIICLLCFYYVFGFSKESVVYINRADVVVDTVEQGLFVEEIPVEGIIRAKNLVYVDVVQGGIVEKIYVEDGDSLQCGDTIIKLQNIEMELRFMEQETRIYDAINNLQSTELNLARNKFLRRKEIIELQKEMERLSLNFNRQQKLFNENAIAQKEYEDALREYKFNLQQLKLSVSLARFDSLSFEKRKLQINSSIQRMYNNLKLLQKSVDNLVIKSPAAGIISSFSSNPGETKSPRARIGQIEENGGYKLAVKIDENYIGEVSEGLEAVYVSNGIAYKLKIAKIYSQVKNGFFKADLLFVDKVPASLKSGQSIRLKLGLSAQEHSVMLKKGNFYNETGGRWIYVIDESGDFAIKRNISTGKQSTNYYQVTDGLFPGEKAIISSYELMRGKEKVRFKE